MTPEAKHVGLSSLRLGFKSRPGRLLLGFCCVFVAFRGLTPSVVQFETLNLNLNDGGAI